MEEQSNAVQYAIGDLLGRENIPPRDAYESARKHDNAIAEYEEEIRILRERVKLSEQARLRSEAENRRLAGLLADMEIAPVGTNYADFLSMLVHEFRNPLTPILTSAQLLKRYGVERPELLQSAVTSIERQVRQFTQMIADLSDFARMGQGGLELNRVDVDLIALVTRIADGWRPYLAKRHQQLTVDFPYECGALIIQADPVRLTRTIEALLIHASRYTPAEGSIRLALQRYAAEVGLVVRDEAGAIDPIQLDRIFEPFAPLAPPLHGGKYEGMGIALALAKYYTEMHGGIIRAESMGMGRGNRFVVSLPFDPPGDPGTVSPG